VLDSYLIYTFVRYYYTQRDGKLQIGQRNHHVNSLGSTYNTYKLKHSGLLQLFELKTEKKALEDLESVDVLQFRRFKLQLVILIVAP
jgi:hypothetical protein